jgi:hypothetical protein
MHHVLLAEDAAPRVQNESVQTILKTVGVKKAQNETAHDAGDGMWKKPEGDPNENGAGQDRSQQVVSLDSQPLGFPFGPNYVIRNHRLNKLSLSLICRKHASSHLAQTVSLEARERQSPDWRHPNRQSGDWRSRATQFGEVVG